MVTCRGFGRLRRRDASSLELDDTFPCIASFSLLA
jgi:hypothetical protein